MSTQQRMKDRIPGTKPRVCKLTSNGMWWAEVRGIDGVFRADCFFNHEDAIQQAHEYAAMNRAARLLDLVNSDDYRARVNETKPSFTFRSVEAAQ